MDIITEILKNDEIWFQLFDIIRIIEPGGTHRVISCQGKENIDQSLPCYHFWERDTHCANCISKRANMKQKTMMKLEYRNNRYCCVVAKPVEFHNENYIMELIMNISDQINNDEEDGYIKKYMQDLVERLETAASRDSFTKLYNKVYMKDEYDKCVNDCSRSKVYMALLDMNNFKEINDVFGHDCGDEVILKVADLLKSSIPEEEGIVARFGGDEFGIIFKNEDEEKCNHMLINAKKMIDSAQYQCNDDVFTADISYGLAEVKDTEDFYEAIHIVDKQLYWIKRKEKE